MTQRLAVLGLLVLAALGTNGACDCGASTSGSTPCTSEAECPTGWLCIDGFCRRPDAGPVDGDTGGDGDADGDGADADGDVVYDITCPEGGVPCAAVCCPAGQECRFGICVTPGMCAGDEDCGSDSYCLEGACIPYGTGPRPDHNPDCTRIVVAGLFAPTLQCSWEGPPAGDAYPANRQLLDTPMVVDFDFDGDPTTIRPSIVFTSYDGTDGGSEQPTGIIRIVNGRDCLQQASLDMQYTSASSPPAVGDIDGDGRPEIVAFQSGGGLVAFDYDATTAAWSVLWRSHLSDGTPYNPTGGSWTGPALHDLDDDGRPEILRGGLIFDSNGTALGTSLGVSPDGGYYTTVGIGIFPVVADVDADTIPELVTGAGVYQYDAASHDWVREAYSTGGLGGGHAAIADFNRDGRPEVAAVSDGAVNIHTLESTVTFGPVTLPDGGAGGPPTVADFDGDTYPEVASAGARAYSVFDPDCIEGAARGGTCASGRTDGVLWSSPTQDLSSNVTGSSVFDFEGDGPAEVVYADECFVRVYAGPTGEVIFSQKSSSCTWYENPIVADVDGDFNSELVVAANTSCATDPAVGRPCSSLEPGNIDPLFAGLHCDAPTDCVSGVCDAGLCRCTTTAECCTDGCVSTGYVCAAPPAGTAGTGNTCRASRPTGFAGLRVYRDAADMWVGSRPVWNQHPYHVTHVRDDGTIPRTSDVPPNWTTPGLNNFRQNVQGDPTATGSPDLTSGRGDYGRVCDDTRTIDLTVLVCNRGTEPVGDGIVVTFYDGPPDAGGTAVCSTATDRALLPGECDPVTCAWVGVPDTPTEVYVDADPSSETRECVEGNNWTTIPGVRCEGIG